MSRINNQTRDIVELTFSQDLNESSTNRKALPHRSQENKKQGGSQIALHPNIVSVRAIQDAYVTQLLRENGFDINAVDFDANITLLWATHRDQTGHTIQFLLRKGANVEGRDHDGRTALH